MGNVYQWLFSHAKSAVPRKHSYPQLARPERRANFCKVSKNSKRKFPKFLLVKRPKIIPDFWKNRVWPTCFLLFCLVLVFVCWSKYVILPEKVYFNPLWSIICVKNPCLTINLGIFYFFCVPFQGPLSLPLFLSLDAENTSLQPFFNEKSKFFVPSPIGGA